MSKQKKDFFFKSKKTLSPFEKGSKYNKTKPPHGKKYLKSEETRTPSTFLTGTIVLQQKAKQYSKVKTAGLHGVEKIHKTIARHGLVVKTASCRERKKRIEFHFPLRKRCDNTFPRVI